MNLLLLGGTLFVGRHLAEIALARGHTVAAFTRGRRPQVPGVRALVGDRDPRTSPGLVALDGLCFDAVVDTSGYVPRVVEASSTLLASNVGRYLFVSSVSVYAGTSRPGVDESDAVATLDDPATEEVPKHYGALKAACESVVARLLGLRATIVRPGLIVGPYDATDRFGYWPARFGHPHLLGDRPARAVVPAPRERGIQCIDVRDLAAWMLDLVERDVGGTFNAISAPAQWTWGDLVDECMAAASAPPVPAWVDDVALAKFHVEPWTGLPLWIPASEADAAGFALVATDAARSQGLAIRPLAETVRDTAAWLAGRDNTGAWKNVLGESRERQILSAVSK